MREVIYKCRCGLLVKYGEVPHAACLSCPRCMSGLSKDPLVYNVPNPHAYMNGYCMNCGQQQPPERGR